MEIAQRFNKSINQCVICGQPACSFDAKFSQNTGVILIRYYRTYKGNMCRACAKRLFRKTQLHNLFFGWWGYISFVMTAIYLVANSVNYGRFLSAAKKAGY